MLTPRLTDALYYTTIPVLMDEIDNALAAIANELYYNIIYSLHTDVTCGPMDDLLHYKRILLYKLSNSIYANSFTVEEIAGRVKILISGITSTPINILNSTTSSTTTIRLPQCSLSGTGISI
jgi:hypothetical protein